MTLDEVFKDNFVQIPESHVLMSLPKKERDAYIQGYLNCFSSFFIINEQSTDFGNYKSMVENINLLITDMSLKQHFLKYQNDTNYNLGFINCLRAQADILDSMLEMLKAQKI